MKRISIKIGHLIWSFFLFLGRKSNGLEKNIITINDTRYAYLAPSTVDPEFETIVLIHGFTGFKEYWSDFMRSCRGKLNFIVIDLPGHGESGFDHETSFQKQTSAGFYPVTADIPKKRHTVPKECSCPDAENIAQSSNAKPSP